jgi:hypothetical protein
MTSLKNLFIFATALPVMAAMTACTPEVGSEAWCEMMKEKPKGEWTANEAADFTKYCLIKMDDK